MTIEEKTSNGNVFRPRDFGARGDGFTKDTAALQQAIDACSASGGGRVALSEGTFLTGTLFLRDGVELSIDASATLLGSLDAADYPHDAVAHLDPMRTARFRTSALIVADRCRNVAITGRGRIDCNGQAFVLCSGDDEWTGWKYRRPPDKPGPPRMILFAGCEDVLVTDVSLVNAASGWGYWVTDCDRVVFDRAKVLSDPDYPNNDGIHINASRDVSVTNCRIVAGDDAIVVRCNNRPFRDARNRVCERVTVTNCQLMSYANAIRLAWTNDGTIRNCAFSNLAITDSAAGIGIDLPPPDEETGDYGREATLIENLVFSFIVMDRVYSSPIRFAISDAPSTRLEAIHAITFSDIRARAYKFNDFRIPDGRVIEDVVFRGCDFTRCADGSFPGDWRQKGAAYWWNADHADHKDAKGVRYECCTCATC